MKERRRIQKAINERERGKRDRSDRQQQSGAQHRKAAQQKKDEHDERCGRERHKNDWLDAFFSQPPVGHCGVLDKAEGLLLGERFVMQGQRVRVGSGHEHAGICGSVVARAELCARGQPAFDESGRVVIDTDAKHHTVLLDGRAEPMLLSPYDVRGARAVCGVCACACSVCGLRRRKGPPLEGSRYSS